MTLRLEQVTRNFDGLCALDGVSLEFGQGEIMGLIGPNGSGKTTLLGIASGILKPTSGRVSIEGQDPDGRRPDHFARLGIGRTFQQIRLFDQLSVEETIGIGAIAKKRSSESIPTLLRWFKLDDVRDHKATTLSYGVQRRVEIARALAGEPRYLLLDEPAAGMNEQETDDLLETVRDARDSQGFGLLVVDHDLSLIMRLCERIHVLSDGQTIAEGSPAEVQRNRAVIESYLGAPRSLAGTDPPSPNASKAAAALTDPQD